MNLPPFLRKRGLLAIVVVIGGVAVGGMLLKARQANPAAPGSASSAAPGTAASAPQATLQLQAGDVLTLRPGELAQQVNVSGALRARQSAFVKAKVAGELLSLAVREGEAVRAGQVIGQIDTQEAALRVRQAEQQLQAAQAQQAVAERALANNQAMVGQGFISSTALDTSRFNAEGARATVQAAQAALELARKAQADAHLVAPIAGLIAQRLAQPGERVAVDAKVVEIVDLSQVELEAAVAPQDVVQLRIGQSAKVQVDGLPEALPAKVARINPSANAAARTVSVYLSLPAHPALRQGLFAQGTVAVGQRNALVVPSDALRLDQPEPAVLVLENGQVQRRKVRTGAAGVQGGVAVTELLGGVAEGAQVLAARVGLVREGTPAKLTAAPPVGASGPAAGASAATAPAAAR